MEAANRNGKRPRLWAGWRHSRPLRRKKKPAQSLDAWVPISRDLMKTARQVTYESFSVFSFFVSWFFPALVVVARRRPFALWGNDHSVWRLGRAFILLLGKRTRRYQTAYSPCHYFSFQVEHRISCPPHAHLTRMGGRVRDAPASIEQERCQKG